MTKYLHEIALAVLLLGVLGLVWDAFWGEGAQRLNACLEETRIHTLECRKYLIRSGAAIYVLNPPEKEGKE